MSILRGLHKHHIVPRHLGGSDDVDNLVLLHPIDHAIWHLVRYKTTGNIGDLRSANLLMSKIDDTHFGWTCNAGENNPMFGKKHSDRVKQEHSKRMSGRKQSAETIANRVAKTKGQIRSNQSEYMKQRWAERKAQGLNCRIGTEENKCSK